MGFNLFAKSECERMPTISHKFKTETVLKVLKEMNFVKSRAAKKLGMSNQNMHYLIKNRQDLREAIEVAKEDRLDIAESALFELVESKNFPAIRFTLETLGRHRGYGAKIEVERHDDSQAVVEALSRKYKSET